MFEKTLAPEERVLIMERIKEKLKPLTMEEVSQLSNDPIEKKPLMAIKFGMLQLEKEAIQAELEKISAMDKKLS